MGSAVNETAKLITKMQQNRLLIIFIICAINLNSFHCADRSRPKSATSPMLTLTNDNLLIARCRSECNMNRDKQCEKKCIGQTFESAGYKKYGDCPDDTFVVFFKQTDKNQCTQNCSGNDYKCPGIKKCCSKMCGMSCEDPLNLESVEGMPPKVKHIELLENTRNFKTATIKWEMPIILPNNSPIYYIVESRSHIGVNFALEEMSVWRMHMPQFYHEEKSAKHRRYEGNIKLKPGRWYQFRIASVNELGTKGYSELSQPFQLHKRPRKPNPPSNITFGPLIRNHKFLIKRVNWLPAKSDLPIDKYKISWSLRLKDANETLKGNNGTMYKESAVVAEPKRFFEIKTLRSDSIYYLQVQAISVYGRKRLKSIPETAIINTTLTRDVQFSLLPESLLSNDKRLKQHQIRNVRVKFLPFRQNTHYQLSVRVSWNSDIRRNETFILLCRGKHNCLSRMTKDTKALTYSRSNKNSHDFTNLKFNSQYTFGVRGGNSTSSKFTLSKSFFTPTCEMFLQKNPQIKLTCPNSTYGTNLQKLRKRSTNSI